MRIIGGKIGGIRLYPPNNLPVRPTTDIAKEALFNILQNRLDFEHMDCLDLFAGTGNIALELASRGALSVDAVDIHFRCVRYISDTAKQHGLSAINTRKADVFKFIQSSNKKYDFIFADPPYDIVQLPQLAQVIFEQDMLHEDGLLVIEHPSTRQMQSHPFFDETRKYGYSSFSFYSIKP